MPLTGTLRTWHDDRGFGFIAPTHGGREIFVHISAFPNDGSRPTEGERLTYELGRGQDGKVQAVKVVRTAAGHRPPIRHTAPARRRGRFPLLVGALLIGTAASYGYSKLRAPAPFAAPVPQAETPQPETAPAPAADVFRCDGRRHCSQMTSCAEAKYFLRHCPNVEMDGDHDGIPCEQQWCTSPFSK